MGQNQLTTINSPLKRAPFQVIEGKRKIATSSAVCINQHVKACVHRLVFNSELEISSLRQVARLVGITGPKSEAKVLDLIRETVREATRPLPPSGPASTRRMAA